MNAVHIVMAMKPIESYAENALAVGVAGLNIKESRITTADSLNGGAYCGGSRPTSAMGCVGEVGGTSSILEAGGGRLEPEDFHQPDGRWPSNIMIENLVAPILDKQSGISKSSGGKGGESNSFFGAGTRAESMNVGGLGDEGGASRFFKECKT